MVSSKPSLKEKKKKDLTFKHDAKLIAVNDGVEDFEAMLQGSDQDDSSEKKIAKELFSNQELKTKTDLSDNQISLLTKGYFLADELGDERLRAVFDTFIELRISRKRKSRAEFIEALKGMDEVNKQAGMFGRLGSMFGSR